MGRSLTVRAIVPIEAVQSELTEYKALTAAGHRPARSGDRSATPESGRLAELRRFFWYESPDEVGTYVCDIECEAEARENGEEPPVRKLPEGHCFVELPRDACIECSGWEDHGTRIDLSKLPPDAVQLYVDFI